MVCEGAEVVGVEGNRFWEEESGTGSAGHTGTGSGRGGHTGTGSGRGGEHGRGGVE